LAASVRTDLGIGPVEKIDLEAVAEARGVEMVSADALVGMERLHELERLQAFAFSACTFEITGTKVVVFNPLRDIPRRRSDIAHELGHIILEHELDEIRELGAVSFRTCRADQEEEATAFGGALLLPRQLLLSSLRRGMDLAEMARQFQVTESMARYRINMTGVQRQVSAAGSLRGSPKS
jgi:Zn-dependent peptidase ImmA (M78 family)